MTKTYVIEENKLDQLLSLIPKELRENLKKEFSIHILDCLFWTKNDSDQQIEDAIEELSLNISHEEIEELKDEFSEEEFDVEPGIERVNELIYEKALEFLRERHRV